MGGFGADKLGRAVVKPLFCFDQHLFRKVDAESESSPRRDGFDKSPGSASHVDKSFEFSVFESFNYPLVFLLLLVSVEIIITCG